MILKLKIQHFLLEFSTILSEIFQYAKENGKYDWMFALGSLVKIITALAISPIILIIMTYHWQGGGHANL